MNKQTIDELKAQLVYEKERNERNVAQYQEQLEAAQKACAEMRAVLERSRQENLGHRCSDGWFIARDKALSSDCGKGYVKRPCYCLGQHTIEQVAKDGQLQTENVDFVAADELFHNNPFDRPTKEQVKPLLDILQELLSRMNSYGWGQCGTCQISNAQLYDADRDNITKALTHAKELELPQ